MAFVITNNQATSQTYQGVTITSGGTYSVSDAQQSLFALDIAFLADLMLSNLTITVGSIDLAGKKALELLSYIAQINASVQSLPFIGSKTILVSGVVKRLYARHTGIQAAVTTGANTINYTVTYPWAKIVGIEIVGAETLDTSSLKVFDNALGTYSGVPNLLLNQFGYDVNVAKDFYRRDAQFDADIYQGMVVTFSYTSISNKTVGVNILINEVK